MLKAKAKGLGRRITAGADKAYDTADHVAKLRASKGRWFFDAGSNGILNCQST